MIERLFRLPAGPRDWIDAAILVALALWAIVVSAVWALRAVARGAVG